MNKHFWLARRQQLLLQALRQYRNSQLHLLPALSRSLSARQQMRRRLSKDRKLPKSVPSPAPHAATTVPDSKEWNRILNFSSLRLRCMYGVHIFNTSPVERVLHGSVAWSAVCTST